MLEYFIGLGISSFSTNHRMIQFMRRQIGEMSYSHAKYFAKKSLSTRTVKDFQKLIAKKRTIIQF